MKKSNEQLAKNLVNKYRESTTFDLEDEIKKALDIAAGIAPEVKFKFGDPVVDHEGNKGLIREVGKRVYVVAYEDANTRALHGYYLSPDPDYANMLKFIKHDGSSKCPHDLRLKSIRFYKSGLSAIGEATSNGWDIVKLYAVIPEGWLE